MRTIAGNPTNGQLVVPSSPFYYRQIFSYRQLRGVWRESISWSLGRHQGNTTNGSWWSFQILSTTGDLSSLLANCAEGYCETQGIGRSNRSNPLGVQGVSAKGMTTFK
jgi:hypothetical protein